MRSLLKSLEPYQEEFARQRITVSFSLYDMPWLVATNNSDTPEHGIHYLSGELPAQCAVPPASGTLSSGFLCPLM